VALPAGTRIEVTAYYDNSDRNSAIPTSRLHPSAGAN
jgi:hypothetical protein